MSEEEGFNEDGDPLPTKQQVREKLFLMGYHDGWARDRQPIADIYRSSKHPYRMGYFRGLANNLKGLYSLTFDGGIFDAIDAFRARLWVGP